MPAPVRPPGETRRLILDLLRKTARPMTWPEITRGVEITAGYRTQRRMLQLGEIEHAGFDHAGTQLYAAGSRVAFQPAAERHTSQPQPLKAASEKASKSPENSLGQVMGFEDRSHLLDEPHMRSLAAFRRQLLEQLPEGAFVPNFDPHDGGVTAKVLLLLETPGRTPRRTGFTSLDNPSATSRNLLPMVTAAGLKRTDVLMWNLVPWDVGSKTKVQQTSRSHHSVGTPFLLTLIELLLPLRAIIFIQSPASMRG
jgi:hypothetical protein